MQPPLLHRGSAGFPARPDRPRFYIGDHAPGRAPPWLPGRIARAAPWLSDTAGSCHTTCRPNTGSDPLRIAFDWGGEAVLAWTSSGLLLRFFFHFPSRHRIPAVLAARRGIAGEVLLFEHLIDWDEMLAGKGFSAHFRLRAMAIRKDLPERAAGSFRALRWRDRRKEAERLLLAKGRLPFRVRTGWIDLILTSDGIVDLIEIVPFPDEQRTGAAPRHVVDMTLAYARKAVTLYEKEFMSADDCIRRARKAWL